ncbi:MAG: hypothetical protein ACUVQD_00690 [Thermaceae bacterium]
MRKLLLSVLAMVLGGALAQGRLFSEVSSGNLTFTPSANSLGLSLGIHAGAEDVLGPLALRGGVGLGRLNIVDSSLSFNVSLNVGVDVLYFLRSGSKKEGEKADAPYLPHLCNKKEGEKVGPLYFPRPGSPDLYFGGGLGLNVEENTPIFNASLIAGTEIPLTPDFGVFAELRPQLSFPSGNSVFALGFALGPRLYFR